MKLLFYVAALLAVPSLGIGRPKYDANLLIGLWKEDWDTRHAIVLRQANGTYQEKVRCLYDESKPPVFYTSSGTWKVRGSRYITTTRSISVEVWKKPEVGRTLRLEILQLDGQLFRRLSHDNADVEERKIGRASEANFAKARPELLLVERTWLPLDPTKKVRKAIPVAPHEPRITY